jgi:hypothetical protein
MNRRGFFAMLGAAAVAPIVPVPELDLEPLTRKIFLPPAGGWLARGGNTLLTIDQLAREALQVFRVEMAISGVDGRAEMGYIRVGDRITIQGLIR